MRKYFAIVRITFANALQYRWEFAISQARTILVFITLFFLWTQVFKGRTTLFGFNQKEIISYIFLAAILKQFVIVSATDQIANELQSWGKFFSYLLRPIGYFRYWFTVDLVYKLVSLVTISIIATIFINVFNISLNFPSGSSTMLLFFISTTVAVMLYFYIGILVSTTGFWTTQVWGLQFLTVLILEFSAGAYFPIDVLPQSLQTAIKLTPFPYLLYYPISIFLGKLSMAQSIQVILVASLWLLAIYICTRFIWQKGLKVYEAWGG